MALLRQNWLAPMAVVLGLPLLLLLLTQGWYWSSQLLREPPPVYRELAPFEHPEYRMLTERAISAFQQLPDRRQAAIHDELAELIQPADEYLHTLSLQAPALLCVGENHDDYSRAYLARELLPRYPLEALLLETSSAELPALREAVNRGEPRVTLLNADIAAMLRAARARNPRIQLHGVDKPPGGLAGRDEFIARRVREALPEEGRALLLLGALHCADSPGWLFHKLANQPQRLNLRLLGDHQEGPGEAFVYFLRALGLARDHFAIADTRRLPAQVREWFTHLDALHSYRALLVYRTPRDGPPKPPNDLRTAGG